MSIANKAVDSYAKPVADFAPVTTEVGLHVVQSDI
jgi:hypothetical protein